MSCVGVVFNNEALLSVCREKLIAVATGIVIILIIGAYNLSCVCWVSTLFFGFCCLLWFLGGSSGYELPGRGYF